MSDIKSDIRAAYNAWRQPIPYGEYRWAPVPADILAIYRREEPDYTKPVPMRAVKLWGERVVHNINGDKGYAIFGQLDGVTIPVDGPPWVMGRPERAANRSRHGLSGSSPAT